MQSKIYIAVSGCKRGFSVFYTSPGLDASQSGIAQSLCDMRKYLRVAKPGIDYFGLDFIQGFRVCSIYRSTNDSAGSSGGFISAALIIPDNLSCSTTRTLLSLLLDTYYSEHFNRQFGTPIPGTTENGAPLEALLAAHITEFHAMPLHYKPGMSNFSAPPIYIAGATDAAIDTVFASPYHKAYLAASKIIMLPAPVMAQPAAYSVTFNGDDVRAINAISGLSDRLIGRLSPIVQHGCSLTSFYLNGIDYTTSYSTICLIPSDRISFSVVLPNGRTTSFDGSVQQALASKILLASRDVYGFNFFSFDVAVAVNGLTTGIPRENIFIPAVVAQKNVMPIAVNARSEGHFTVRTQFNNAALALVAPDGARVLVNPAFLPTGSDLRAVYPIDLRPLTLRFPRIVKGKATLEIGGVHFPLDLTPDPLTILIPASLNAPMVLCIAKNRWPIDPTTGICESRNSSVGFSMPIWLWGVIAACLIAIGGSIWFFASRKQESKDVKNAKVVNSTAKDTSRDTSGVAPNPEDFSTEIAADGTVITKKDNETDDEKVLPGNPENQPSPNQPADGGEDESVMPGGKPDSKRHH